MDAETLAHYLDYPVQAPPEGVVANFVNPNSISYQLYITAGVCIPLMLLFSLTRLLSKVYIGPKSIKTDEIVFVAGLVLCLLFVAMTMACVSGSVYGRHAWDVLLGAFTKPQLVIIGPIAIGLVKISVLILYLQIFGILKWMRVACIAGIVFVTAFHLSMTIAYAAMCAPSTGSSQLDFLAALVSDSCAHQARVLVVIQGAGSIAIDCFLFVLPLPAVWDLQMPLKRKVAIISMLMVGFSACASSIISLVYRVRYYTAGGDNTRLVIPLWATAMSEQAAGVMICCMPTTAALLRSIKGPVRSWLSSVSGRALRLTSSYRSDMLHTGSQSKLKENIDSNQAPIYFRSDPHEYHTAWADAEVDTYSLQHLSPHLHSGNTGVWKRTDIKVSRVVQEDNTQRVMW